MLLIVATSEQPGLAETTGRWRWEAFFRKDGLSLDEVMEREHACAREGRLLPSVLVLLSDQEPLGMIALCEEDLEGRSDLDPWLAGMFIAPTQREQGHARRLIAALENHARSNGIERLSLYTATAVGLYLKCGWLPLETFEREGKTFTIMQKRL